MHRFYVPQGSPDDGLVLTGREAHHALHVLRLRPGDAVCTLNGIGRVRDCIVHSCARDHIALELRAERHTPPLPCEVTLCQAIAKGKSFESIVQKATEIGAARIIPLLTERVVVDLDGQDAARKTDKWRVAAIEAAKQCGTPWLPEIAEPVRLRDLTQRAHTSELSLLASLQPGSRPPAEAFREFRSAHKRSPMTASAWVGPEGDFTPEEVALIESTGALPITLGPFVLRADTAAVYCLSILSYECISGAHAEG